MQWNSHFNFDENQKFHFVELFSGAAHTSRAWFGPEMLNTHIGCGCVRQLAVGSGLASMLAALILKLAKRVVCHEHMTS